MAKKLLRGSTATTEAFAPIAGRAAAFSDPARLHILWTLSRQSEPIALIDLAGTLARETGRLLTQPTVSHHVGVLVRAGVVTAVKHGTRSMLSVEHKAIAGLLGDLEALAAHGKVYV